MPKRVRSMVRRRRRVDKTAFRAVRRPSKTRLSRSLRGWVVRRGTGTTRVTRLYLARVGCDVAAVGLPQGRQSLDGGRGEGGKGFGRGRRVSGELGRRVAGGVSTMRRSERCGGSAGDAVRRAGWARSELPGRSGSAGQVTDAEWSCSFSIRMTHECGRVALTRCELCAPLPAPRWAARGGGWGNRLPDHESTHGPMLFVVAWREGGVPAD